MKAVIQELGTGRIHVIDAPVPAGIEGHVCVQSRASVISSGTERMLLRFARKNILSKARSQRERVREVLERARTDGVLPTLGSVRDKLSETVLPGYSNAGVVVACGDEAASFRLGDRVVSNGPHAEIVRVPYNLCTKIPEELDFEAVAFAPLCAIALHGLRLARPSLGESVVVYGLGLVGQLAVQIASAFGCRVFGVDLDPERAALATTFGAIGIEATDRTVATVCNATEGIGADIILLTLATDSCQPIHLAAQMSRKRGRIVLLGVTGLRLRRADFYEKELSFQVSCSYGPGRYDRVYEEQGQDYPLPYVRWTAKRNFEAVLQLMAEGRLDPRPLITHRFPIDEAPAAYNLLLSDEPSLGIVLTYPDRDEADAGLEQTIRIREPVEVRPSELRAGVLGAGSFARRTIIPSMRSAGFHVQTVVSATGLRAALAAERSGAELASSDATTVFEDESIDTVFVLTRHDSHADYAVRALKAGKHLFVEKPLALRERDLDCVREALEGSQRLLTVGFNRRFAPLARRLKQLVERRTGIVSLVITVNAGRIDPGHWTQDPVQGGGWIVGETCHFIDLARFLVGLPIESLAVQSAADRDGRKLDDVAHLTLAFGDGSTAAVHYLATGSRAFPKERVEAFFDGRTAAIDNWRRLRTWGLGRWDSPLRGRIDKGHRAELQGFARAVREGGPPPIPVEEIFEVSSWSIRAARLARGET